MPCCGKAAQCGATWEVARLQVQVLGELGEGLAGSCSAGRRVWCLLEGTCSRDRWSAERGRWMCSITEGAGVACGCNAIKVKHEGFFGGGGLKPVTVLAAVELVPRRPPSTTRLRNTADHRHINALSLNRGPTEPRNHGTTEPWSPHVASTSAPWACSS